jgi:purine-nucleoside phosphorylase
METHLLYTLAARHGLRAVALCAMMDSVVTGEHLPAAERQSSLRELADLALTVATTA